MKHPDDSASKPTQQPGTTRRHLAANLRLIRLLRNWSQEDLAQIVDLDRSFVSSIERAERNLSVDILEKIARALGMSIADLIREPNPHHYAEEILEAIGSAIISLPRRIRDDGNIYLVN